jgi:hypothetical protein
MQDAAATRSARQLRSPIAHMQKSLTQRLEETCYHLELCRCRHLSPRRAHHSNLTGAGASEFGKVNLTTEQSLPFASASLEPGLGDRVSEKTLRALRIADSLPDLGHPAHSGSTDSGYTACASHVAHPARLAPGQNTPQKTNMSLSSFCVTLSEHLLAVEHATSTFGSSNTMAHPKSATHYLFLWVPLRIRHTVLTRVRQLRRCSRWRARYARTPAHMTHRRICKPKPVFLGSAKSTFSSSVSDCNYCFDADMS